jgi:aminoglycoside 6-adenylyltransferase
MQFADGNRIDLGVYPLSKIPIKMQDSLTVVLLDKDGLIPSLPPADERGYLPRPPTAKQFADCCNEFWWVSAYVAKGLWREELPYARQMLEVYTREQLTKMLVWYIGVKTGFAVNPGKFGKYFQKHLEPELWELLLKTYADGSYERAWDALFAMGDLFRLAARRVAGHFGFRYNETEDRNMSAHLRRVRALPRDAQEMY